MTLQGYFAVLLEMLLPSHCILCGLRSGPGRLCQPCLHDLPRIEQACRQCAAPLGHSELMLCGACLRHPPAWDIALAALVYDYPADQLVQRFKFQRNFACGQLLADELTCAVKQSAQARPELLIPVPLHFTRRFQRGFNQAELLARAVGAAVKIPVRVDCLVRTRRTAAQSGLDRAARRKNLRGAFSCGDLAGARIALVDDVLTTGTTLEACARAARKAGAAHVSVWVAARVPPPTGLRA